VDLDLASGAAAALAPGAAGVSVREQPLIAARERDHKEWREHCAALRDRMLAFPRWLR